MDIEQLTELFERQNNAALDRIKDLEAEVDQLTARANRPGVPGVSGGALADAKNSLAHYARTGEFRAEMHGVSDPDGGYLIPSELADEITNQLIEISPIRRVARVEQVSTPDFSYPVNRRGASSGWAQELSERAETDSPNIAMVTPRGAELYANVPVSNWLLEDSRYDISRFIMENVQDEMAFQEGVAFVSGDGVGGKPKGYLAYDRDPAGDDQRPFGTIQTIPTGSASDITADSLIDLVYSLKSAYRQGGNVAFAMNSTTLSVIRKLKDGNGQWLWQDSMAAGQPGSLLGFPVVEAEAMPNIAAGNTPIALANWRRGYLISDVHGMSVIRDPYTRKGYTSFYISRRTGGAVLDSNSIKLLEISAS